MPRPKKETKKTETKKAVASKAALKTKKATPAAKGRKKATLEAQQATGSAFSGISERIASLNLPAFWRGKNRFLVLGFLGLVLVMWGASKYMIVGWVDQKPITRIEYYQELEKKYGKDLREQIIVEKLVQSEAQKRNVTVSEDEISKEITKIEEEQGGAQQLEQILQIQGVSRQELRKLVQMQLLKQKMFEGEGNVTDDDVTKYIDQNKDTIGQQERSASEEAKLRSDVKEQLKQQKISTAFNAWIRDALQSSRVVRL